MVGILWCFVENQMTKIMWICFWVLYSVQLIYLQIFTANITVALY